MTVLFSPDSFKGSLTAVEVARALARGWSMARPDDTILLAPLADGGEGTVIAVEAAGGWQWRTTIVHDPHGRRIKARWLLADDGRSAVVEMAEASGLSLVEADRRDPLSASTEGTGELIRAAVDAGATSIMLGIGGSATTDGGAGMLSVLSRRAYTDALDIETIHIADLDPGLAGISLTVACDVTNPLLGAKGAAATYGPQKGATVEQIPVLDASLRTFADRIEAEIGRRERDSPGAGAAGGLGFGLLAARHRFAAFELRPGIDLVMEATGFDDKLRRADVVLTGEGRIDAQTAFGKTAMGVARRARDAGKSIVAVGGGITPEGIEALAPFGAVVVPVVEGPQTVGDAMAAGTAPVERAGERIARLVSLASRA